MLKSLNDNVSLSYLTYNKGKSVSADSKSYLDYVNNFLEECNDSYQRFLRKKLIHDDYSSTLPE